MKSLACLLVVVACDVGDPAAPPSIRIDAVGAWKDPCKGPFEVAVTTEPDAKVTALDREYTAGSDGKFSIDVPVERAARPLTLNARNTKDRRGTFTLPVAAPPAAITSARANGNFRITVNGNPLESSIDKALATNPDHTIVELAGCRLVPATIERPGVKITVEADRVRADFDAVHFHLHTPGSEWTSAVDTAFTVRTRSGTELALQLGGQLAEPKAHATRLANVAKDPYRDAPLPSAVAAPRSVLVVSYGTHVDREHLDAKTSPMTAPYVALVDLDLREHAWCHYGSSYGGGAAASRMQNLATVSIYVARTGRMVARRVFAGSLPKPCPASVMTVNGIAQANLDGSEPDAAAVTRWIVGFRN